PVRAGVGLRAGVTVVARRRVVGVHAAAGGIAAVVGAAVMVVAVAGRSADAGAVRAGVVGGARVAVVAGVRVEGGDLADAGRGAGAVVGARVAVVAGAPGRLALTGRRAAVPVAGVAVALLAVVEDAVAADVGDAAGQGELIGLDAARGQPRTLDAEEVVATGAAGDALVGRRVADHPRRRRDRAGGVGEETGGVAVE